MFGAGVGGVGSGWRCGECFTPNPEGSGKCLACQAEAPADAAGAAGAAAQSTQAGAPAAIAAGTVAAGEWRCGECFVKNPWSHSLLNPESAGECRACQAPPPGQAAAAPGGARSDAPAGARGSSGGWVPAAPAPAPAQGGPLAAPAPAPAPAPPDAHGSAAVEATAAGGEAEAEASEAEASEAEAAEASEAEADVDVLGTGSAGGLGAGVAPRLLRLTVRAAELAPALGFLVDVAGLEVARFDVAQQALEQDASCGLAGDGAYACALLGAPGAAPEELALELLYARGLRGTPLLGERTELLLASTLALRRIRQLEACAQRPPLPHHPRAPKSPLQLGSTPLCATRGR